MTTATLTDLTAELAANRASLADLGNSEWDAVARGELLRRNAEILVELDEAESMAEAEKAEW